MRTYRECYGEAVRLLEERGVDNASYDAMELLENETGMNRAAYFLNQEKDMPPEEAERFFCGVSRRAKHEPLQHILGWSCFFGRKFEVNGKVLIPRADTECLVESALKMLAPGEDVLDMCAGTGCIGITLALEMPCITVTAADISREALEMARHNARRLQARNVDFVESDLFSALDPEQKYDMVISNPPYVPTAVIETLAAEVRDYDPVLALDGGRDGLDFYKKIIHGAAGRLKPRGKLLFEIGCDQGAAVMAMMREAGFGGVRGARDLAGLDRVVWGCAP